MSHTPPVIVVADSDVAYLGLMQDLLTQEGYEVLVSDSGASAYELIREKQADIAILDIPIMAPDAPLRTLAMLRLDPRTKHIPVLVCSTQTALMQNSIARLRKMGCTFLAKPFTLHEMTDEIHILLGQSRSDVTDDIETGLF